MTKEAGKRPGIWGDMFYYYPEEVPRLDKDVLIFDWYYYTFETAPRVELYDHEPMDTAKMYRANGIESWGCPASFYTTMMPWCLPDESVTNARDWTRYCLENGSDGIMVTQWELSPATIDQCLPVEAAMAGFLWGDDLNTPTSDLLRDACAFLYDKPELAPLLEEMGRMRFHGHGTRRWYNAQTLPQMITYLDPAPDLALAARMEEVGAEIARIARDAKRAEMALAFVPAARWLVYQYRKRALVNQAALAACAGRYSEAGAIMQQLRDAALKLADQYQAEWNRNRYAGDTAALPTRLHHEAALFDEEMAALAQAAAGDAYAGHLTTPILVVRVVDKFGTMARIDAAVSADGETFTDLGVAWVLQFDSRAAGKYEAQEIPYTFPVSNLDAARYVKITASGPGHYAIQSITLHQGTTTRTVNAVSARGMVEDAGALLTGGLAILGHPDPKALFHELLAAGDSSQVFTVVHGSVTTEMGG
ncbi:MAG: hypothetical protein BWY76_03088 [bacterium ADurb.Bin429]|nr:MAG: hypothetical protein BWY76_03088 [bacterium ADurb.Bin429]